jgi:hypothetical protein
MGGCGAGGEIPGGSVCCTTRGPRWWTFSSSNAPELPPLRVEGGELRCRRRLWIQDRGNQPVALIGLGQPGIIELVLDHARLLAVAPGATVLERVDTCHVEAVGQHLLTREPDVGLDPPRQLRAGAARLLERSKL